MASLTQREIDHFLNHGYIKISSCFTCEESNDVISSVWTRLGITSDKSTWNIPNLVAGRINMPALRRFPADEFAPKAWSAICELLAGEGNISSTSKYWGDGLIVNLGTDEGEGRDIRPQDLDGWHVDGDFFMHYLDSPEQALLVVPLFTDIRPGGGGTFICPPAIRHVARQLYDHPEGVSPRFRARSEMKYEDDSWFNELAKAMPDDAFIEITGQVGDVYLLHPLMLHCASNNKLRDIRIITNPPVSLKKSFQLERADRAYSVVERKTLRELGMEEGVGTWKITSAREDVVPERIKRMEEMKKKELVRMKSVAKVDITEREGLHTY